MNDQRAALEIHWGGKVFRFASAEEALKAGFHIGDGEVTKDAGQATATRKTEVSQ